MWSHGHVYKLWQAYERVPYLQAVRCEGGAHFQGMKGARNRDLLGGFDDGIDSFLCTKRTLEGDITS